MQSLKKRADFLRLRKAGRWSTPAFVMQGERRGDIAGQSASAVWHIGFTVADRAIATIAPDGRKRGGAVKRNRARRRLKEAARLTAPRHARPDFDYVIIGRIDALTRNFADLLADMEIAFHKVHEFSRQSGARGERRRGAPERADATPKQGSPKPLAN
jgi:ribonuclease P protein component